MEQVELTYKPQYQCFIRKDTPELRAKLIALNVFPLHGWEWPQSEFLWVGDCRFTDFCEDEVDLDEELSDYGIDCGTDEEMFLQLAFREPDEYISEWMSMSESTEKMLDKYVGVVGTEERETFDKRVKAIDKYFDTNGDVKGALLAAGLIEPKHEPLVMTGFVARDRDGSLTFYADKPYRHKYNNIWFGKLFSREYVLPSEAYPNVQWEDEPLPVTLTVAAQ